MAGRFGPQRTSGCLNLGCELLKSYTIRVALIVKKIPDSKVNSTGVKSPLINDMIGPR